MSAALFYYGEKEFKSIFLLQHFNIWYVCILLVFPVLLEIIPNRFQIPLQPSTVQLNGFNRLGHSSFGSGERMLFEKHFHFFGSFFGREIFSYELRKPRFQERTLKETEEKNRFTALNNKKIEDKKSFFQFHC